MIKHKENEEAFLYDEENFQSIREEIEAEDDSSMRSYAYTLLQRNAASDVIITESSRKKCVEALLR